MDKIMKVALFYGHYSSNIGDVAINAGLVNFLRKALGDDVKLHVFFLNSTGEELQGVKSFSGLNSCEFKSVYSSATDAIKYLVNPRQFIKDCEIEDVDLVLVNGGEHFFSYHHNSNWHNVFWRSLPLIAAWNMGLRSAIVPSSFGPFETDTSKLFMNSLFAGTSKVACRDSRSAQILLSENFIPAAPVCLDMAFFLPFLPPKAQNKTGKLIGVIVRPDKSGLRVGTHETRKVADEYATSGYTESTSYDSTLSVMRQLLLMHGFSIRLFIQSNADESLTETLYKELSGEYGDDKITLYRPESVDDYLSELAKCDCIYTSRFHAAILGYVAGTPSVSAYFPEHGHKMPGMYEYLGRGHFCFELTDSYSDGLSEKIVDAITLAIDDYSTLKLEIEDKKTATIEWMTQLLAEDNEQICITSLADTYQYHAWWSEIISVSERKKVETELRAKNIRQKEILSARDLAYKRLKDRENLLLAKIEKFSVNKEPPLKKDNGLKGWCRKLFDLVRKSSK